MTSNWSASGIMPEILKLGDDLYGVEIGVENGINSKLLLDECSNIKMLYGIDPYAMYLIYDSNVGYHLMTKDIQNAQHKNAEELLSSYVEKNRYRLIRHFPNAVADNSEKYMPEKINDIDFIFIDGDHSYTGVMQDMISWYPKIRSGGIVSGHDWDYADTGVKNAVLDYITHYLPEVKDKINVCLTVNNAWFFYKP